MKILDTLYYAVYRFVRRLGHKPLDAEGLAGILMPLFFILVAFFLFFTLMYKLEPKMIPHKMKPYVFSFAVVVWIASYFIYGKGLGQRVISQYEKSKNQNFYVWLGAIFSLATLSLPIWMYFIWRAIM